MKLYIYRHHWKQYFFIWDINVPTESKIINNDRHYNNLQQYILTKDLNNLSKFYDREKKAGEFKYATYRQVNGPGAQLINRLRGIDDLSVFYNIKTSTLSLLQPKIRLYKVQYEDYKTTPSGEVIQSTIQPLPVPCYKEFKFSDNFGVETAASVQDYLGYESTKPSFRNAGLYGFTIVQNGETHGTIENNIECKLELKFKSLKDLTASPPGEPGLRYTDLILWPPSRITPGTEIYNPKYYEIKAIIGYTAPSEKQLHALNISQREVEAFRDIEKMNQIVSLGMYDYDISIEENGLVGVSVSFRGRLETVLGSNQVNVFQDSVRIGDAGQFILDRKAKSKINISHVYKIATSIKALWRGLNDPKCISKCEERTTLKDLTENDPLFSVLIKEAIGENVANPDKKKLADAGLTVQRSGENKKLKVKPSPYGEKYVEWFKKLDNIKLTLGLLKNKTGIFKQQIYLGFIDKLIESHPPGERASGMPGTRVYCAIASKEHVKASVGTLRIVETETPDPGDETKDVQLVDQTEIKKTLNNFFGDVAEGKVDFSFKRCEEGLEELAKESEAAGALLGASGLSAESSGKEPTETKEDESATRKLGIAPTWMNTGDYKFYFVFLGDIIELACKNAKLGSLNFEDLKNDAQKQAAIFPWSEYKTVKEYEGTTSYPLVNARILLGPLEYVDHTGRIQKTNLAKMPISFAYFRSWFVNTIIKRRRTQMPLGAFFASLINNLVIPALGINMPQSFKAPHTRASIISVTLPGIIPDTGPGAATHQVCGESVPNSIEALPIEREIFTEGPGFRHYLKKIAGSRESEKMLKTSFDYLLMYITSFKDVTDRTGDPAEDIKEGIYHFNIGSDQGLLRKMDFNKVNIPYLAELRSAQAEEEGIDQLQQLKLPYDTNVEIVGTSLFTPGMYYYVNPSLAGLGSVKDARSLASQMNLGGYHLIGTVTTRISAGLFETKIVGTQTAQGK